MSARLHPWRLLLIGGGLLIFVGGAMHGDPAGSDLPVRENLASTMDAGGWVLGHSVMTLGAGLLAVAIWQARRTDAWNLSAAWMGIVGVAVVANLAELVLHTTVILEQDRLHAGETGPLTAAHLAGLRLVYPLYGLTVAALAWRLMGAWPRSLRAISVLGVVGGLCHAASAPIAIATEDSSFEFLFPLAGITVSIWWVVAGAYGDPRRAESDPYGA